MEFLLSTDCLEHADCSLNYYQDDSGSGFVLARHQDDPFECDDFLEEHILFSGVPSREDIVRMLPKIKESLGLHADLYRKCPCAKHVKKAEFWYYMFNAALDFEKAYAQGRLKEPAQS